MCNFGAQGYGEARVRCEASELPCKLFLAREVTVEHGTSIRDVFPWLHF